ncbi:P-loop containing nucleoside triphosphate hydrolases superfamily protein [Striga hermonthica]|uniref:P-loop containing nucleoside triphosphate hydrolases superfamily protein n=1 Tax=Striga hermonthica TaxID=68872 RepID=A0A9N7NP36_STRHE|nr:P-loop containing nucleoside triphosphate hydrolases superfamily protein [Striga hermonthica]
MFIDEFDGLEPNDIYQAAEAYLGPKLCLNARRLKIGWSEKDEHYRISAKKDHELVDTYAGQTFKWVWICRETVARTNFFHPRDYNETLKSEARSFELTFHRKNRDLVVGSYLLHVACEARRYKLEKKTVKIHTVDHDIVSDEWVPATFDTLAIDPEQKGMILRDLDMFLGRREHYQKVSKTWKMGCLLYGPSRTGKSSLIAAIANYLKFDVYDLKLKDLPGNSYLRRLLASTANGSIMVVEDIDCAGSLGNRSDSNESPEYAGIGGGEGKVGLL